MKSLELRQNWNGLIAQAETIYQKAQLENRQPSEDETAQFDELMTKADELKSKIGFSERGDRLQMAKSELKSPQERRFPSNDLSYRSGNESYTNKDVWKGFQAWCLGKSATAEQQYHAAQVGIDCHSTSINLRQIEQMSLRSMSVGAGSGSAGTGAGYTVPIQMTKEIDIALKYYSNPRNYCRVLTTEGGQPFNWPSFTDTGNLGEVTAELGVPTTDLSGGGGTDPTFGNGNVTTRAVGTFNAYTVDSSVLTVSVETLQDSIIDLPAILGQAMGERLGRKQEALWMTANSLTQGYGLATLATKTFNCSTGDALTFNLLKQFEHSLDIAYRDSPNAGLVMNDGTLSVIEQIQDDNGRPIFLDFMNPGTTQSGPMQRKLFGRYPIYISNQLANLGSSPGANQPVIVFGDLSKFVIRIVSNSQQLVRFNEYYRASNRAIGFLLEERCYSNLVGPTGTNGSVSCLVSLNSSISGS